LGVVAYFMASAQWEEALSPLSSNPALFEDGHAAGEKAAAPIAGHKEGRA
jgi:hypothetical protein